MLTLQSHNQVIYHLSQLSSGLTTGIPHILNSSKHTAADKTHESEKVICKESLQKAAENCNTEHILKIPTLESTGKKINVGSEKSNVWLYSPEIKEAIKRVVSRPAPDRRHKVPVPWHISYCSTESFDQNKRLGGPSQPVDLALLSLRQLKSGLPPQLLHSFHQCERYLQQRRGFKTERTQAKEKIRDPEIVAKFTNFFQLDSKSTTAKLPQGPGKLPNIEGKISMEAFEAMQKVYQDGFEAGKSNMRVKKVLFTLVVVALAGGFLFFNTKLYSFSHIHRVDPSQISVTFADVKGVEQAKKDLTSVVEFLKNPQKFHSMGARLPKGILLVGAPGTGKTLLAKAVAGEAGVPFFFASGSEFDEVLVGEGARRVRNLFNAAKMHAPCVIFLDELDSVGGARTSSRLHPYANQTINQLLTEMDGFSRNDGVIVLAATNRRSDLDEALLRPGRFDMQIKVSKPLKHDRWDLLKLYLDKVNTKDLDMELLAKQTAGFTGATIESMINMAAITAAIENSEYITMDHLMDSIDRVIMGPVWDNKDKASLRNVAYHEAGHTVVSYFTANSARLDKVTIQPRGSSVGYTKYVTEDKGLSTKAELTAAIDGALGGRAAEELIFGIEATTVGAHSDLQRATEIATEMVKRHGMCSSNLRVLSDEDKQISNESLNIMDAEIDKLLKESMDRVRNLLRKHKADLDKVTEALLKYETLSADDLLGLLGPQVGYASEQKDSKAVTATTKT